MIFHAQYMSMIWGTSRNYWVVRGMGIVVRSMLFLMRYMKTCVKSRGCVYAHTRGMCSSIHLASLTIAIFVLPRPIESPLQTGITS